VEGLAAADASGRGDTEAEELAQALELSMRELDPEDRVQLAKVAQSGAAEPAVADLQPEPRPIHFAGLAWPTGEPVGSLAAFLAGPPGDEAGLPMYAVALAGLGVAELTDEQALAEAGVTKRFHRKRIGRWVGSLVKLGS
jgi:hypothetical protein